MHARPPSPLTVQAKASSKHTRQRRWDGVCSLAFQPRWRASFYAQTRSDAKSQRCESSPGKTEQVTKILAGCIPRSRQPRGRLRAQTVFSQVRIDSELRRARTCSLRFICGSRMSPYCIRTCRYWLRCRKKGDINEYGR